MTAANNLIDPKNSLEPLFHVLLGYSADLSALNSSLTQSQHNSLTLLLKNINAIKHYNIFMEDVSKYYVLILDLYSNCNSLTTIFTSINVYLILFDKYNTYATNNTEYMQYTNMSNNNSNSSNRNNINDYVEYNMKKWMEDGIVGDIIKSINESYWDSVVVNLKNNKNKIEVECGKIVHFLREKYKIRVDTKSYKNVSEYYTYLTNTLNDTVRMELHKEIETVVGIITNNNNLNTKKHSTPFNEYILGLLGKKNTKKLNVNNESDKSYSFTMTSSPIELNLLKYFLPPKTLVELSIIGRFIRQLHGLIDMLNGCLVENNNNLNKNKKVRALLLLLTKVREINTGIIQLRNTTNILHISETLTKNIKHMLHVYNLTNGEIYEKWVGVYEEVMEICEEQEKNSSQSKNNLTTKLNSTTKLKAVLADLHQSIVMYGENDISDIIYRILFIL